MSNIFNSVQLSKVQGNTFNLSHDKKMSIDMGRLVPIFVADVLPGDKWKISSSQLVRFAPMLAPVMHKVKCYTHYFFVPNRLLWDNWENFITGGEDGDDTSVMPTIAIDMAATSAGSLGDYLGLPLNQAVGAPQQYPVQAMPFAAYQFIYNEYYRDQNLIDEVPYELVDGDNDPIKGDLAALRRRAWSHDYFTSALPWTQKGNEATIPLGTTAPITFDPLTDNPNLLYDPAGNTPPTGHTTVANLEMNGGGLTSNDQATQQSLTLDNSRNLFVDLSTATAASINDLRRAFRLQEWLEKNARGGSRYIESILVHFGVRSSDARLQRPEYLGGGAIDIQFSEVLQTGATPVDPTTGYTENPQANMAGHGIGAGVSRGISYRSEEHGWIIGIMSVLPKTAYYQGIPKMFLKNDRFDYYWPEFANIGEQPILNRELYHDTDQTDGDDVFGYTPRYAEYKFMCNSIHGDFRTSLDYWHMARDFENKPALNQQFVEADPTERIFAVEDPDEHKLYVQVFNKVKAYRLMSVFGTPTI